jgi:subtilisin family serine protease
MNGRFDWSTASDEMVWSALQQGDNVLSVGYKPANVDKDISGVIHTIDISKGAWADARNRVLQLILEEERMLSPSLTIAGLEAYDESTLPVIDVMVNSIGTIRKLRQSNLVRYAEPIGYEPRNTGLFSSGQIVQTSSSGCGSNNAEAGLTEPADYVTIAPGAKQSWNYGYHGIANAWTKTSGAGKKLMIIDTGLSPDQVLFSSLFNSGSSSGRTIERKVTLRKPGFLGIGYGSVETSTADGCGHGTSMAGAAASPRNASGGTVGVAYNANLQTVRAGVDVFIDESREAKGVSDAFVLGGNTASVNIISMSMGRITSSSQIQDAVNYAYNKGKLIFCAAGTSFGWSAGWWGVIFPAWLPNVNAVTGLKDDLKNRCSSCHDGPEVDFVVVMEKSSNGRTPLSTAQSGLAPSTVGGSSVATATTAGIAALVWSKNPSWTRDQVLNKMAQSSSYYPTKNGTFGWGVVNADLATN